MRQNSSSFWWDVNDDHMDTGLEVLDENSTDPFPSTVSATVYTEQGIYYEKCLNFYSDIFKVLFLFFIHTLYFGFD